MKTKDFLSLLENNLDKQLVFEYSPAKWVGANYHITEVKNIEVNSVDCGGKKDSWKETVVQLWEDSSEIGKEEYLKSQKALDIFNRVHAITPLLLETEIKFEYGNKEFHTAQLEFFNFEINNDKVIVKMHPQKTDCKARDVCTPAVLENECAPNSGCC